jgi:hypothetical protein
MRFQTALLASVLALSLGCSKKSDDKATPGTEAKTTEKKEAEPASKKPLDAAWFGKTVMPPGQLAKIKPGSKKEDAQQALPELDKISTADTGFDGVSYAAQDLTEGMIPGIHMPADKLSVLEQAWGPGQKIDRGGKPAVVWFNAEQGIRAAFSDTGGGRAYVRFEPYMPVAKMLGDGPNIAMLDKPFQGKTDEELKAIYPNLVGKTGRLSLPSTEWEFGSGIPLSSYPMNKIESLTFSIPYKTPEAQAEIMKVIEAKWGEPKGEVPFGSVGGEKTFVYNKKDPHIEVTDKKDKITIRIGGKAGK